MSTRAVAVTLLAGLLGACGGGASQPSSGGATARATPAAPPRPIDWLTYMGSPTRSGQANLPVPQGPLRIAWRSPVLDGATYAEPLVSEGTLIVATQSNTLYALSPADGHILWHTHLGDPDTDLAPPCTVRTLGGLTSTPVIDPTTHTIYAGTFVQPGVHELVALDSRSGTVRFRRPIEPRGENPFLEGQRGALALANGMVYIPFGGRFGDCGRYHGAVMGIAADGSGPVLEFRVRASQGAGIWAPTGVVVEPGGNLLVTTGNTWGAAAGEGYNDSNSVIRLSPQLRPLDYWAPRDWQQRSAGDVDKDVGSLGPLLVGGDRVLQAAKHGTAFLLHRQPLGHVGGEMTSVDVGTDAIGSAAYSAAEQMVLVPTTGGMDGVSLGPGPELRRVWSTPTGHWYGPPLVGHGAVWTVDVLNGTLYVLAVKDGAQLGVLKVGPVVHFTTPTPVGKLVVVATTTGVVAVDA
ncbi:MAG: PQQ-binding-like beta-propeller repeat protein [Candidatus Dormibacteria bacterium]